MQNNADQRSPVVGILGTPGTVLFAEHGVEAAMHRVGMNTGNLLFQYSCTKNIKNAAVHFNLGVDMDLGFLKEAIDVLVIPAANQLNPHWDLKWWVKLIEDLDKPVVIVGLGAQAKIDEVQDVVLQPGTVRFLHAIRERAKIIGVRGENTLRLVDRYGVSNAEVTGCPSNFINQTITGESIAARAKTLLEKEVLRVNMLVGTLEEYARESERLLFKMAMEHHGRLIYQTNDKLLAYLLTGREDAELTNYLNWEAQTVAPGLPPAEYRRKIRHRGRYFFSAPGWIDDVARDDLSFGMRIHGAVAAIQGGSLGVCVAFDARTLELAQTMGYPYVRASDLPECRDVRDVVARMVFSAEVFDHKRSQLKSSMKRCLEQHGVTTHLSVDGAG